MRTSIIALASAATVGAFAPSAVGPAHRGVALEASRQVPHGGKLVNLMAPDVSAASAGVTHTVEMTERQSCDVELLCNGGFSPLTGFMDEDAYKSVVAAMQLPDGLMFSLPVVFDTSDASIKVGAKLLLKENGVDIATLEVSSVYTPDKPLECKSVYGTSSLEHPGTQMVAMERGKFYVGGKVTGLSVPKRDFPCQSPSEVRAMLPDTVDIVAFQCRNPVHRAHYELFTRALDAPNVGKDAVVLVHPTCGPTQPGDIPGTLRYKTYEVLKAEAANPRIVWAYLPYSMHMAGPREAIHHMMIRKNFGCTHFIIGRDMAGCKSSIDGEDFYGAYDAQEFALKHGGELGVEAVPSLNLVYTAEEGYITADKAKEMGLDSLNLSGTKFRKMLNAGDDIPEWFAFKSVVAVLRE
ncbi:hypothetical protein M885DRAFT_506893 [Pelagophyceae sp. CCMP2097]|nr:hypothetical protein M885DRAFT_506893 [Pelagophyceae sp. CCMP2097]